MKQLHLRRLALAAATAGLLATLPLGAASEKIDYEAINKIKQEGMQNSKVMEISSWLTDVYGPRLTGSPMMMKGAEWAMAQMKEWGLQNVHIENWTDRNNFTRGWTNDKFYMAGRRADAVPDSRARRPRGRRARTVSSRVTSSS